MATTVQLLTDGFGRVHQEVHAVLDRAGPDVLLYRPDDAANTVAWLVWHLTRIQDDHVAGAAGFDQRWTQGGWAARFRLPFAEDATGYGQRADEVAQVRCDGPQLAAYHDDVSRVTMEYLADLAEADLDRIVDRRFTPPVSLAVRLVSVLSDDLQHVGQAAYVRGLAERHLAASHGAQ